MFVLQVLSSLGTETVRPSSAAQCVANIACTELPQGLWPELINTLCNNVTNPGSTEMMKESCLEAIGYICQDIVCSTCYFIKNYFLLTTGYWSGLRFICSTP